MLGIESEAVESESDFWSRGFLVGVEVGATLILCLNRTFMFFFNNDFVSLLEFENEVDPICTINHLWSSTVSRFWHMTYECVCKNIALNSDIYVFWVYTC